MKLRKLLAATTLAIVGVGVQANPMNADFSAGFDHWSGAITDSVTMNTVPVTPTPDPLDPAEPHFGIVAGLAQLSNDFDFFRVILFQTFTLGPDAGTLSFDFKWMFTCADPTDPCAGDPNDPFFPMLDRVEASLVQGPTPVLNLFPAGFDFTQSSRMGTVTTDVSAFAGQLVSIEFLLEDGDFNEADTFSVDNIVVTAVPEPGILVLVAIGLAGVALRRRA